MRTLASAPSPTPLVSVRSPWSIYCRATLALVGAALGWGTTACGDPPPRFSEPMVLGGQTVAPEVLQRGARVYGLYCVSCHGADGSGRANASRSFDRPPRDFREAAFEHGSGPPGSLPTDADLDLVIRRGIPGTGMPPWDGLPDEDRHAVIQFIKTFSPRWISEVPAGGEANPS